jgi:uncharacterized membrane protein YeaQ/YmgE (transglycosylase-associated protein family)
MDRRVLWLCLAVGTTVGGFLPEAWGASGFGLASLVFSALGGIVGVWVAARISESI